MYQVESLNLDLTHHWLSCPADALMQGEVRQVVVMVMSHQQHDTLETLKCPPTSRVQSTVELCSQSSHLQDTVLPDSCSSCCAPDAGHHC